MAEAAPSKYECPVCHEDFIEPKLLSCAHLVCRKCVISWLNKGGKQAGCPLCRAAILPEAPKSPGGLAAQVDKLPTDFSTAAFIDSKKLLSGRQVCHCCEERKATLFCLQCSIKLCRICSKMHSKIPATQGHEAKDLTSLTAEELASHHRFACGSHSNWQSDLYCSSHDEMVCVLCAGSTHRSCSHVAGIGEAAAAKREELRAQGQRLKVKEAAVKAKINTVDTEVMNAKAKFEAMRDTVKARFHDLQKLLDAQEKNCYKSIQEREDAFFRVRSSYRAELEEYRGSVSAHNSTVEQLVVSAPDGALLAMATKLKTRLDSLEQQATGGGEDKTRGQAVIGDIVFDQQIQVQITEKVNTFGRLTDRAEQEMQGKMTRAFTCASETFSNWTVPVPPEGRLHIGDRVMFPSDSRNEFGTVRWVGVLPDDTSEEITVGVEFDNRIGTGTGKYKEHRLFCTKHGHAALVPQMGLIRLEDD